MTESLNAHMDSITQAGCIRRFFARVTDCVIFGWLFIILFLAALLLRPGGSAMSPLLGAFCFVMGISWALFAALLEGLWYRYLGATPGKRLFALAVVDSAGQALTPVQYTQRAINATVAGGALYLPVIGWIFMARQAYLLSRLGAASYDRNRYLVQARPWHIVKKILATGISAMLVWIVVMTAMLSL